MRHQENRFMGSAIILLGILLILDYYHWIHFGFEDILVLGIFFWGYYLQRQYFKGEKGSRNLLLGMIAMTYGGYIFLDGLPFMPYSLTNKLWPIYIIGPGLGYLQMYYYGHSPKRNFKTGTFLTAIGTFFLIDEFITLQLGLFSYVALILFGIYLLSKNKSFEGSRDHMDTDLDKDNELNIEATHSTSNNERYL